jgi:hypothetical protein
MLKTYYEFIKENYETGLFNYNNLPLKLKVGTKNNKTFVDIYYGDKYYENLSVDIPKSDELEKEEFYINPDIPKEMIDTLTREGFIQCTCKKSKAGDKPTMSYKLV